MFLFLFFKPPKKAQLSNFNEIWHKKMENLFSIINFLFIWWAIFLTNFLYDPSGIYLSGSIFVLHQRGPKKPQSIWVFSSRGWNALPGACSDLDVYLIIKYSLKLNCCPFFSVMVDHKRRGVRTYQLFHVFCFLQQHNDIGGCPLMTSCKFGVS